LRQIAGKIGRSHAFVRKWNTCFELHGTVADQPRSGRRQKLSTEAAQQAMTAAQDLDCKTAGAIAVRVEQQSGVKMSLSTTKRYLRKQGLQHLRPRIVPILTANHKAARLAFAKAALRSSCTAAVKSWYPKPVLAWQNNSCATSAQSDRRYGQVGLVYHRTRVWVGPMRQITCVALAAEL